MRIRVADTCPDDAYNPQVLGIEGLTKRMWGQQATDWILPILWGVARKYPKGVYGEIGTRAAISTMALALAARESGGQVYTMDIGTDHKSDAETNLGIIGVHNYVTLMTCDSTKTDFPEPLDVLYIDGDHSYDGVFADYERHSPNVKDGGTILFHDPCSCEQVGELVRDIGGTIIEIEAGLGIVSKGHHLPGGEIHAEGIRSERVGNESGDRGLDSPGGGA